MQYAGTEQNAGAMQMQERKDTVMQGHGHKDTDKSDKQGRGVEVWDKRREINPDARVEG